MNKKKLAVLMALFAVIAFAPTSSFAVDATDSETYTVKIPSSTNVVLNADVKNFGTITGSEFGTDNPSAHNIVAGNGTGTDSYVVTNDPTNAGGYQYKLTFASVDSSSVSVADGTGKAVLTLGNQAATASVNIDLTNSAKTGYPALGSGTPKVFTRVDSSNLSLTGDVGFSGGKAPLDFTLHLDGTSVTMADAPDDISFDVIFTAVIP